MNNQINQVIPSISFCLTSDCNQNCIYCKPNGEFGSVIKDDFWDISSLEKTFQYLYKKRVKIIRITGGEPLLKIYKVQTISKLLKKIGFKDIRLQTNGILLGKYLNELNDFSFSEIKISLDSLNPITYKKLSGYDYNKLVIKNIKEAKKIGLPISINSVVTKFNEKEIRELLNFAESQGIDIKLLDYVHYNSNKHIEAKVLYFELAEIIKELKMSYGEPEVVSLGRGLPMLLFYSNSGKKIIVKDQYQKAFYGKYCRLCELFPCSEGLVTLYLSPDCSIFPCDNLILKLELNPNKSNIYQNVEIALGYFSVMSSAV